MNWQKSWKKLGIELPEKYPGCMHKYIEDLHSQKRISDDKYVEYTEMLCSVPMIEVLKNFADYWGLTYLAEKAKEKIALAEEKTVPYHPVIFKFQRIFC